MPNTGINQGGIVQPTDVPSIQPQIATPQAGAAVNWNALNQPQAPNPSAQQVAGMPPITDPIQLAQWHDQQEMSQLGQFDQQLEALQAPVRNSLKTSYEQYQIDYASLMESGVDAQQKVQRLIKLNATYDKKWIGLKSGNALEREAIQQQRQQAEQQIRMKQILRMKEIQTYAGLADQGVLSPEEALRLQYKTIGYDIPVTSLKPEKPQNPIQRLQNIQPILEVWDEEALHYRTNPKTGGIQRLNPEVAGTKDTYSDTDWVDVGHAGRMAYFRRQSELRGLTAEADRLRSQIGVGRTTDLSGAARKASSPLVQSVAAETPEEVDVTKLSDAELRRLAGL